MIRLASFEIELDNDDILEFAYYDSGYQTKILEDGSEVTLDDKEQQIVTKFITDNWFMVSRKADDYLYNLEK